MSNTNDYVNRQKGTYDAESVLLSAGDITSSVSVGVAPSNEVNVGENVELSVVLQVRGAVSGTTPTMDVKIQEADEKGGTYTDVSGGAFVQATGDSSTHEQRLIVLTKKPWVSVSVVVGGTSPSFGDVEAFVVS